MTQIKPYTLNELAEILNVTLVGAGDCQIDGLATLHSATAGKLSFLSNPKYSQQLEETKASAVIVHADAAPSFSGNKLISDKPYVTFAHATALFADTTASHTGIHPTAIVASTARVGDGVTLGANVVVGENCDIGAGSIIEAACSVADDCSIGMDCHLKPNVILYQGVKLGDRALVHSNAVLGADGFGFAFDGERSVKIHQLGGLRVGDDVEIGAGSTIDRGALDDTVIEQGVKIDNQVQIGHNCHIGEHTIICGCVALAGSVTIGKYCIMGGASGAVGHITLADRVQVSAMSLVSQSITEAGMYSSGTGHMKTGHWKRNIVRFQQLEEMNKRIRKLEKK